MVLGTNMTNLTLEHFVHGKTSQIGLHNRWFAFFCNSARLPYTFDFAEFFLVFARKLQREI